MRGNDDIVEPDGDVTFICWLSLILEHSKGVIAGVGLMNILIGDTSRFRFSLDLTLFSLILIPHLKSVSNERPISKDKKRLKKRNVCFDWNVTFCFKFGLELTFFILLFELGWNKREVCEDKKNYEQQKCQARLRRDTCFERRLDSAYVILVR